jgi:hypothetical protein
MPTIKNAPKKMPGNRKSVRLDLSTPLGRQQFYNQQREASGNLGQMMTAHNQYFIVTLFYNLKKVAEAVLRWAFFSINLFMLALYIC